MCLVLQQWMDKMINSNTKIQLGFNHIEYTLEHVWNAERCTINVRKVK